VAAEDQGDIMIQLIYSFASDAGRPTSRSSLCFTPFVYDADGPTVADHLATQTLQVKRNTSTIQKSVFISLFLTMKTTLDLNDALLTKAKTLAAQQRTSLTRLIEEGLQMRLRAQQVAKKLPRLPVYRGKGGLVADLDGLSNKAMLDAADQGS
jgi:hypothetical protein